MGGTHYPEESLKLDWNSDYFGLAYDAFQDYKNISIKTDSIPYTDKKDFKNSYPIYSVDLSNQAQKISDVKSNIVLHVDFNKHVPEPTGTNEGTVCCITVISKSLLVYEPAKNRVTDKFN